MAGAANSAELYGVNSNGERDSDQDEVPADELPKCISRSLGQHRRVSAVIEKKVWTINGLVVSGEETEIKEFHKILKNEQEKEKKRRMSAPYGAAMDITDVEFFERSRRLSNVHEDLFKLFAIHSAVTQQKFEQQRLLAETNKQILLEELRRKATLKVIKGAVEMERQRRIKSLKEMAEGKGHHCYEIADMNARMSNVHAELKEAFHYIWEKEAFEENERVKREQETKMNMNNVIGQEELSSKSDELAQKRKDEEEYIKITEKYRQLIKHKLRDVQEELKAIFTGIQGQRNGKVCSHEGRHKEQEGKKIQHLSFDEIGSNGDFGDQINLETSKVILNRINLS